MSTAKRLSTGRKQAAPRPPGAKVAKSYRLVPARIEAARQALGAKTDTEAIETALDLVVFRRELIEGTSAMAGVDLAPFDRDA
jgi:hypothetical protein